MERQNSIKINIAQELWIIRVKERLQMVEEIDEEEKEIYTCVFSVPKDLLVHKPEAYVPQSVSIGPYHHWRPELYEMERYKLVAARRLQKRIPGQKFESVVEEFSKFDRHIRSHYHKWIDYNEEALSWLMALDASFLLQCLQFYVKQRDQTSSEEIKKLGKVLDPAGTSTIHNETLRDLMMLENQIPLFLLQKLLEIQLGSHAVAEEKLCNLVRLACIELSPFKFKMPDKSRLRIKDRGHILEAIYYSIVPLFAEGELNPEEEEEEQEQQPDLDSTYNTKSFTWLWNAISSINVGVVQRILALSRVLMGFFMVLFGSRLNETEKDGESNGESTLETPPTREELSIPSVTDLYSGGVKFLPTNGDLTTIRFDKTTGTLYLPPVKLDANTEVILRNLVAFEAAATPGPLFFTRYTDFMNGIIDKEEDVRLLTTSGIIYNHLESDGKVASLWNSRGRYVKLTKLRYLDEVIADVNKYYNKKYRRRFLTFQVLALLAVVAFLLLTCLQAFCSVYECKKWFRHTNFTEE